MWSFILVATHIGVLPRVTCVPITLASSAAAGSHSGGVVSPLPVGGRDHIPDAAPLDVSLGQPPPSARSTLSE